MRDITAASSARLLFWSKAAQTLSTRPAKGVTFAGLRAAMQSCSECLFFMVETLCLARDGKVMKRVKNT